jgi:cell division protein FtsQ
VLGSNHKRRNRFKKTKRTRPPGTLWRRCKSVLLGLAVLSGVALWSLGFVLVYDLFTQLDYFAAQQIILAGPQRLDRTAVLTQAELARGDNILAIKLRPMRQRLLAHPWIANARVAREIPDGMAITVTEHHPAAIIELDRRYLLSQRGVVFKPWQADDPSDLPLVTGLTFSDVPVENLPGSASFEAAMEILSLARKAHSAVPVDQIREIHVDHQMGITLLAFTPAKAIHLGYGDYTAKYRRLRYIFTVLTRGPHAIDYQALDLTEPDRIIVTPAAGDTLGGAHKEA